jgi:hypothetical protein
MIKLLQLTDPKTVIFDPATGRRVPLDGIRVETRQPFWRRRIIEGSMVEASPAPQAQDVIAPPLFTTEV